MVCDKNELSLKFQGIAVFWASRVGQNGSQYIIDGVIPPDEYAGKILSHRPLLTVNSECKQQCLHKLCC